MAELLKEYKDVILSYHEHDSLLENVMDEDLTEEEKKAAWNDYEMEKNRPAYQPPPRGGNLLKLASGISPSVVAFL